MYKIFNFFMVDIYLHKWGKSKHKEFIFWAYLFIHLTLCMRNEVNITIVS